MLPLINVKSNIEASQPYTFTESLNVFHPPVCYLKDTQPAVTNANIAYSVLRPKAKTG